MAEKSRWPPFVQGQTINVYDLDIIEADLWCLLFSGMSDIVVQSQNILSIAL